MFHNKQGIALYRRVEIKTIFPDGVEPRERTMVHKAAANQGFPPETVQRMLEDLSGQLEKIFPQCEFGLVELKPVGTTARFTFAFKGFRINLNKVPSSDQTQTTPS